MNVVIPDSIMKYSLKIHQKTEHLSDSRGFINIVLYCGAVVLHFGGQTFLLFCNA